MMVAFSFITSTSARLKETTASGSYPAFKTSVRIAFLSKKPARLAGIRLHPWEIFREEMRPNKKGTVVNDSASSITRVTVHARLAAVPYEEKCALVHGLGGATCQHRLSWSLKNYQGLQGNRMFRADPVTAI
jgi:hypothetical protein